MMKVAMMHEEDDDEDVDDNDDDVEVAHDDEVKNVEMIG